MKTVDLHNHSTFSDGTCTPSELIDLAIEKGLSAIALTDHDTFEGQKEFLEYGRDKDIELITGVELPSVFGDVEIHILGLLIDMSSPIVTTLPEKLKKTRIERNLKLIQKLKDIGIDISIDELNAVAKGNVISRTHFSLLLLSKGYVKTIDEAYDIYLSSNCSTYVPRERFLAKEIIELIKAAGGVAVLAHPVFYNIDYEQIDTLVGNLKQVGLQGIEAIYPTYSKKDESEMIRLSKKYDLAITGGSDFHGEFKKNIELGSANVPYEVLENLKKLKI